jgi:sugar phosphate permease
MKSAKRNLSYGWMVWALGSAFYFFQFLLRSSPNVMADQLMSTFSIQASALGLFASCYYYAYSTLQIPLGVVMDAWGAQKVLKTALVVCTLGVLIFFQSQTIYIAALGRIFIGAGASGAFLSTVHLARTYLPPKKLAFAVGCTITLGKLGGVSSNIAIVSLTHIMSWRRVFFLFFCIGVFLCILSWILLKQREATAPKNLSKIWEKTQRNMGIVLKQPNIWLLSIYGCLMYLPLSVFTDIWGVSFLMKLHAFSKEKASQGIILVFAGTSLGSILVALLSNKLQSRRSPMILSAFLSVVVSFTLIFIKTSVAFSNFLLFMVGLSMAGQTIIFAAGVESMKPSMSGITTGFINMMVMWGGAIFQPLVGFILDFFWSGYIRDGMPFYTLMDYRYALSIIPVSMLVSLGLAFFIKETFPRKERRQIISAEM